LLEEIVGEKDADGIRRNHYKVWEAKQ